MCFTGGFAFESGGGRLATSLTANREKAYSWRVSYAGRQAGRQQEEAVIPTCAVYTPQLDNIPATYIHARNDACRLFLLAAVIH